MSDATLLLKVKAQEKSGWIAALLNLIFPGSGYIYCHRPGLGIFAFCLCVYMYLNFSAVGFGLWLLFFIDGFLCAGRYNKELINRVLEDSAISNSPPNALQVAEVYQDSHAHSIGLKVGDVLLSINGNALATTDALKFLISDSETSPVNITIFRNGKETSVSVSSMSLGALAVPVFFDGKNAHEGAKTNSPGIPNGATLTPTNQRTKIKKQPNSLLNIVLFAASVSACSGIAVWYFGAERILNILEANSIKFPSQDLEALRSRQDVSAYTVDGELAEAFNLNSKSTDIQRENLLKEIRGKLIIWNVKIYEVNKNWDSTYLLQTSGGLNIGEGDVGTFITLRAVDDVQSKFIEGLKTGDVIRVKGILSGESLLRSLVVNPAILWYPDEVKTQESPAPTVEGVAIGKFNKDKKIDGKLLSEISQFLTDSLGTQDPSLNCFKISLTEEDASGENYCINVASLNKFNNLIYLALEGRKFDENWAPQESRLDQGILKFVVLKDDYGVIKPFLATEYELAGNFGSANSSFEMANISAAGEMAWVTSYGSIYGGHVSSGITLTAVIDNQIKMIAAIPTLTDNSGACLAEETCEVYTAEADVKIASKNSEGIFPLHIDINGNKGDSNKSTPFKQSFNIQYSKSKGEFVLPKEITEIFAYSH